MRKNQNNYDALRLIGALLVLVNHSLVLCKEAPLGFLGQSTARDSSEPRIPPYCDTTEIRPDGRSSRSSAPLAESSMRLVRFTRAIVLGRSNPMVPAAS